MRRPGVIVAGIAVLMASSACATEEPEPTEVSIGVAAAPSLAGAFTELIEVFETDNPEVRIHLELGRSGQIAAELADRTDLNVFASASDEAMDVAVSHGADDARVFARNHVVLAVPTGNPADVSGLSDLAREELRVGLCDPDTPCGRAADVLLGEAGVVPEVDGRGAGSRALSSSLGGGEYDVGIIYRTDVAASHGWVDRVGVDESERRLAEVAGEVRYSIAGVPAGEDDGDVGDAERTAGAGFRDLVLSARGHRALEAAGLQPVTD